MAEPNALHARPLSIDVQYAIKRARKRGVSDQQMVNALDFIGQKDKHHIAGLYRTLWHEAAEHCGIIRQMWHKDICSLVIDPDELNEALARVAELEATIAELENQNSEYREHRQRTEKPREKLRNEQKIREQGWRKSISLLRKRLTDWLNAQEDLEN
jgi:hypothetical protein